MIFGVFRGSALEGWIDLMMSFLHMCYVLIETRLASWDARETTLQGANITPWFQGKSLSQSPWEGTC